jgi:DNA-binding transcriptional LysR family regulator
MSPQGPTGRLRIGTMESTAVTRLPALLSGYHSRWPAVSLEITIGTTGSLIEEVATGKLDCAFVADTGDILERERGPRPGGRGLNAKRVYSEELLLVLPPGHPSTNGPGDLRLSTRAVFAGGCTYRSVLEQWLDAGHGGDRTGWKVTEQASYHGILASVAAGSCFALCPRSVLEMQRVPMDVRTRFMRSVDTTLVSRASYSGAAYDVLLRSIASKQRPSAASFELLAG